MGDVSLPDGEAGRCLVHSVLLLLGFYNGAGGSTVAWWKALPLLCSEVIVVEFCEVSVSQVVVRDSFYHFERPVSRSFYLFDLVVAFGWGVVEQGL
jgi:hypothetical protein